MINNYVDPVKLSCELIKIESITPFAGNSIDTLINILKPMGFKCKKLFFGNFKFVNNSFASSF